MVNSGAKEMMIFCTLFDSGYLDKGLALLHSLHEVEEEFRLYVLAFDNGCYTALTEWADRDIKIIKMEDFETPELLEAKENRTAQEYCWTCSCHVIKYVLEKYNEHQCTYIDADMYFYQSPQVLFDEIEQSGCDVSIIEHGFIPNKENLRYLQSSGKYCIEFNTFYATENGMMILNWWCDRCLECCTSKADGAHFGDQKYLDDWPERFQGVHVIQNPGAGIAPWNLAKYKYVKRSGNNILLKDKRDGKEFLVIFYHYQQIKYYTQNLVDIEVYLYPQNVSRCLRDSIYIDYLKMLKEYRRKIKERYGLDLDADTNYIKEFSYIEALLSVFKYERNLGIALKKVCRIIFRKKKDIIMI